MVVKLIHCTWYLTNLEVFFFPECWHWILFSLITSSGLFYIVITIPHSSSSRLFWSHPFLMGEDFNLYGWYPTSLEACFFETRLEYINRDVSRSLGEFQRDCVDYFLMCCWTVDVRAWHELISGRNSKQTSRTRTCGNDSGAHDSSFQWVMDSLILCVQSRGLAPCRGALTLLNDDDEYCKGHHLLPLDVIRTHFLRQLLRSPHPCPSMCGFSDIQLFRWCGHVSEMRNFNAWRVPKCIQVLYRIESYHQLSSNIAYRDLSVYGLWGILNPRGITHSKENACDAVVWGEIIDMSCRQFSFGWWASPTFCGPSTEP